MSDGADELEPAPRAPRSGRRGIAVGGAWSTATWLLSLSLGLPLTVLVVRLLPRDEYGALAIATAVIGVLSPLAAFGLATGLSGAGAGALATSSDAYYTVVGAARRIVRVVSTALVPVGVIFAVALWSSATLHSAALPFVVLFSGVLLIPLRDASLGLLQAEFRPRRAFVGSTASSVILLGLTGLALASAAGRSAGVIAVARTVALAGGSLIVASGVRWRRSTTASSAEVWALARYGLALVVAASLAQAISQLDVIFLGAFEGPSAVASYAPLSKLADLAAMMVAVLGAYLLPALTVTLSKGEVLEAASLYHWASRWGLVCTAPLVGLLGIAPVQTLDLLFGLHSQALVTPSRVLAGGMFVNALLGFNWVFLIATRHVRAIVALSLLGLIVSSICCIFLIKPLGLTGAAIATSAAVISANAGASVALFKSYGVVPFDRPLVATQAVALLAFGTALQLARISGSLAVPVVACVVLLPTVIGSLVVGGADERSAVWRGMKDLQSRVGNFF